MSESVSEKGLQF